MLHKMAEKCLMKEGNTAEQKHTYVQEGEMRIQHGIKKTQFDRYNLYMRSDVINLKRLVNKQKIIFSIHTVWIPGIKA